MDHRSPHITRLLLALFFLIEKRRCLKELITSVGRVEMDDPWQLFRTLGPLLSHRFLLASAKAQSRGDLLAPGNINNQY